MEIFQFSSDNYLQRINHPGDVSVSLDSLIALHHAQIRTIAFENFDICMNRAIKLSPGDIFNKLVLSQRGGYCFELNGLLLMALKHYGFDARALLARVHLSGKPTGRSHQLSLVRINNKQWIVDLGFGADTPQRPVPFKLDTVYRFKTQNIRIIEDEVFGYMIQSEKPEGWINLYSFDLTHVCDADITYANHYTATHPQSQFVSNRFAALPLEGGMVTLVNYTLKTRTGGKEVTRQLKPGQTYLDALKANFGIVLEKYKDLKAVE